VLVIGGGKIVLIASIMGLVASPFGHAAAYCASKAGVVNLARTLAVDGPSTESTSMP
jgi:NAD(P)-dependent dehydrogenase (short-subunit alcohol dehydrogenase family)